MEQKPEFAPIENQEALIRDTKNGAVLNKDLSSLQKYRAKREKDRQMRQEFDQMKHDMSEIKTLLHKLVNRD